jgi:hypothetical protein
MYGDPASARCTRSGVRTPSRILTPLRAGTRALSRDPGVTPRFIPDLDNPALPSFMPLAP